MRMVRQISVIVSLLVVILPLWSQENRVTIELKDAPVVETFDQLFKAAGKNFLLAPGIPRDQKITLRLVDVPFEKALRFLCDLTNLHWQKMDEAYIVKPQHFPFGFHPEVIKQPSAAGEKCVCFLRVPLGNVPAPQTGQTSIFMDFRVPQLHQDLLPQWQPFVFPELVAHRLYDCPKCHVQIGRVCSKCKKTAQDKWLFCPYDGKKLPSAPSKCPKCGTNLSKTKPLSPAPSPISAPPSLHPKYGK